MRDIAEAIQEIHARCAGMDELRFEQDSRSVAAVDRNLLIIGEAVKQLPDALRARKPEIELRKIAGLRDVLAHGYFDVDSAILWDAVQNKLPDLD